MNTLLPLSWNLPVTLHFIHRAGAVVVTVVLLAFAWKLWRSRATGAGYTFGAAALAGMLALQIALGALTVLTLKNEYVATVHMLLGAFMLAATWLLTFACYRLPLASESVLEAAARRERGGSGVRGVAQTQAEA